MRTWEIYIPVRPKCVQSTAFRKGQGSYVPPKVREWKDKIRPFIRASCGGPPTKLPVEITHIRYTFKYPKATPARVKAYIDAGGVVPYLNAADIHDNLNKGTIDVCTGIVFEDDKQIWRISGIVEKVWGPKDEIYLEFKECPDVMLINGKNGGSLNESDDEVQDDPGAFGW